MFVKNKPKIENMKKRLLFIALFCTMAIGASAQNGYKNAIGVRGLLNIDVSYQRYITAQTRIEGTIGFDYYGFSMAAMHQWTFELPIDTEGIWQWYVGAGGGIGSWDRQKYDKGFSLGALVQVGVEYTFSNIPLLLSLDYRPGFYFLPEGRFDFRGIAVGVRYCF